MFAGIESNLPPGCRAADLDRGVKRLDDVSAPQLWERLPERQRQALYRDFFRLQCADLSALLEDQSGAIPGDSMCVLWLAWRDNAVQRMALSGQFGRQE